MIGIGTGEVALVAALLLLPLWKKIIQKFAKLFF